jgi:DNA-binding NtrC family response regulator
MSRRVLVVEDDAPARTALQGALEDEGYEVVAARDGEAALQALERGTFDAVVSDVVLGGVTSLDGTDVLAHARSIAPDTAVILITGYAAIEAAVEALKNGAFDYLTKPVDLDRLCLTLDRGIGAARLAAENRRLRERLLERNGPPAIVGRSLVLRRILDDLTRLASSDAPVLVTGETGVGKNLYADIIHFRGPRASGPLVRVTCTGLAPEILEAELLGHERGAFPGAVRARRGRFEAARSGTLVLDEVGRLPSSAQGRLERVLEEHVVERLGSSQPVHVDARVIAVTSQDLAAEVKAGHFREDLFYRLSVLGVEVPPLRDRLEDIPLLVDHFLDAFAAEGRPRKEVSTEALASLMVRPWPGNLRELRNCLERALLLSRGPLIEVDDLPPGPAGEAERRVTIPVGTSLDDAERMLIDATLDSVRGNKTRAARILKVGVRTLYRRLEQP